MIKKAIVLLSGGLDSTTTLFVAKSKGYHVSCLIFDYGQRHRKEIHCATLIATKSRCPYRIVKLALPWGGSALLNKKTKIPTHRSVKRMSQDIPKTYVPSRNIIFLSVAASGAEAIGAHAIFIGANAVDYSGYPDCRNDFLKAFKNALKKGTKAGQEGRAVQIFAPLIKKTKAQIIKTGLMLHVPFELTWSCYQGDAKPCGVCDSCQWRQKGFKALHTEDPLR